MGDYFTIKTSDHSGYQSICKLGTCTDWRYVRRDEAEYLAKHDAGFEANIPAVLKCEETLYRFPFPWEDHLMNILQVVLAEIVLRDIDESSMHRIPAPLELLKSIQHKEITLPYQCRAGGGQFNYLVPCPFHSAIVNNSEQSLVRINQNVYPSFLILGERYKNNHGYTIFGCAYCSAKCSLNQVELGQLQQYIINFYRNDKNRLKFFNKLSKRLKAEG